MAEEHGCQSPKGHRLCENNCGFFGSPATQNMCSQCYGEVCLQNSFPPKQQSQSTTLSSVTSTKEEEFIVSKQSLSSQLSSSSSVVVVPKNNPSRCSSCRKKVGLTGFKCKCGTTFCGTHRYPEKHGCTFDFKTVGREEIAKANPLVKGEKLYNRI